MGSPGGRGYGGRGERGRKGTLGSWREGARPSLSGAFRPAEGRCSGRIDGIFTSFALMDQNELILFMALPVSASLRAGASATYPLVGETCKPSFSGLGLGKIGFARWTQTAF